MDGLNQLDLDNEPATAAKMLGILLIVAVWSR